jgi:tetratricopeptide (TPR) repeat protein
MKNKKITNPTFQVSEINSFSAAKQLVLLYFSLLLDKTYSVETLENWFIFPKEFENTLPLREILVSIEEKGWINQHEITTENGTFLAYSCERFVREAILEYAKPSVEQCYAFLRAIQKDVNADKDKNPQEKIVYIAELEQLIQIFSDRDLTVVYLYDSLRSLYYFLGNQEFAMDYGEAYSFRIESIPLEYNSIAEMPLNEQEVSEYIFCKYEKALDFYLRAIPVYEKGNPTQSTWLAACYHQIAVIYSNLGEYQKAISYYWKAIHFLEKHFPQKEERLANLYTHLAMAYYGRKNYWKAEEFLEKVLFMYEKLYLPSHVCVINAEKSLRMVRELLRF